MILQTGRMKAWQDPGGGVSSKQGMGMRWGAAIGRTFCSLGSSVVGLLGSGLQVVRGWGGGLSSTHPPRSQIKHVSGVCHYCI